MFGPEREKRIEKGEKFIIYTYVICIHRQILLELIDVGAAYVV
jgi:hypothetical protein